MAGFFFHMVRTFEPGFVPAEELKKELEGRDFQGYVDVSPDAMTGPTGGFTAITTRVFADAAEWESYDDAVINSSGEIRKISSDLSSRCVSTKGYVFRSLEDFENVEDITPKYLNRLFIRSKHGRQSEVIEILQEMRNQISSDKNKPNIATLVTGPGGIVRLATPVADMKGIERVIDRGVNFSKTDLGKQLLDASEGLRRQIGRFLFMHNPSS